MSLWWNRKQVWTIKVTCFTDGLVSYNAPVGGQMNLASDTVYLNDSVYDGAIIHRYMSVDLPSSLHFSPAPPHLLYPGSVFFLSPSCCCPVTMVKEESHGGEWVMVVYC